VVPANELALALWLESDRMGYFLPGLDADRLAKQQSVVRSERRQRYEDVPYGPERFSVAAALYPEGHPSRHLTIGLHDHIQAATVDEITDWYRTWYVPANATLVIAGDVELAETYALVDRYFGSFPPSLRPTRPMYPLPDVRGPIRETVTDKFATLVRIHRTWIGPVAFDADEPELDVLTAAWGASGTGALWRRLEVHVTVDLRTGSDPAAVRAILDEECARGIDAAGIARQVTRREAGAIWGLTGLSRRANLLQRYTLYTGDPDGLATDLARYRSVTPESIQAVITRWLPPDKMVEVTTVPQRQA
jgi:predicted Zn-dependent peptidase